MSGKYEKTQAEGVREELHRKMSKPKTDAIIGYSRKLNTD
jgi:hypothetical protein